MRWKGFGSHHIFLMLYSIHHFTLPEIYGKFGEPTEDLQNVSINYTLYNKMLKSILCAVLRISNTTFLELKAAKVVTLIFNYNKPKAETAGH